MARWTAEVEKLGAKVKVIGQRPEKSLSSNLN